MLDASDRVRYLLIYISSLISPLTLPFQGPIDLGPGSTSYHPLLFNHILFREVRDLVSVSKVACLARRAMSILPVTSSHLIPYEHIISPFFPILGEPYDEPQKFLLSSLRHRRGQSSWAPSICLVSSLETGHRQSGQPQELYDPHLQPRRPICTGFPPQLACVPLLPPHVSLTILRV